MAGNAALPFVDRADAGRRLADQFRRTAERGPLAVLGLTRGGAVVAAHTARSLDAPFGIIVARKIATPGNDELAMGAVALWGDSVGIAYSDEAIGRAGVSDAAFDEARLREVDVARHRAAEWAHEPMSLHDRAAVLVDDGLATGLTMQAAVTAVRRADPATLIIAVPVASGESRDVLSGQVDEFVCLHVPRRFGSVSRFYGDFRQVSDATVSGLVEELSPPD